MSMVLVVPQAAFAQSTAGSNPFAAINRDLPLSVGQRNFSFRVNDVINDDGSRRKRTSIIAGVKVAPDTTIGFGLFNSMPKSTGRGPDPRLDGLARKSRRAAIGMSLRF